MLSNITLVDLQNQDKNSWNNGTILLIEAALVLGAVFSICCIIVLVTFLQKLNKTMKIILIALCVHNTIGFTVESILFGIWSFDMDEMTCSVMNIFSKSIICLSLEHLALVSFIRYHLSSKTAKNENPNMRLIVGLVLVEYVSEYVITILAVVFSNSPYEVSCLQDSDLKSDSGVMNIAINLMKSFVILAIGMAYDYKLVTFLKIRNVMSKQGTGQSKLIPWKSNFQEYDFLIPVSASVVSGITCICLMAIFLVILKGTLTFLTFTLIAVTIPISILVVQIVLTLRVAQYKKSLPVIERKLNFHDIGDDDHEELKVPPQGLFHKAQLEQNSFRRDVHSVIGDPIEERLQEVAKKLQSDPMIACRIENGASILHVRPIMDEENLKDENGIRMDTTIYCQEVLPEISINPSHLNRY